MSRAVLSLGSNQPGPEGQPPEQLLAEVVAALGERAVAVSGCYRTPPWGPVTQPDYRNAVVIADDPERDAFGWLEFCAERERAANRERRERWGARTLDVDVIAVTERGDAASSATPVLLDGPTLTVPHPRAHLRAFVLVPWAELDPTAELPGLGPIAALIECLDPGEVAAVVRLGELDRASDSSAASHTSGAGATGDGGASR